jgi:urease accessory protein
MQPLAFIHGLQVADSLFPVGAFAYSDGLETAAANGEVNDAAALREWMDHFLENVFIPCEGLALVKGMRALRAGEPHGLSLLDEELTAIRPASAIRSSSTGVGKRLLALYSSICGDERFPALASRLPHGNAPLAYGLVFFHRGIDEREAALVFGYNRLAGIVSAGLRLISIGHQQGQLLLSQTLERLPAAVDEILQTADDSLLSFNPLLDIQQMNHQYVYSRLFRS